MYQEYYGLKERPFSIQPDPDFLFFGRKHSMAFAMLEYGVRSQAGFTVICGEIGCGKTTLIRHLLNNIEEDLTIGIVYNTHKELDNLLSWVMMSFGQPYEGMSDVALYDSFQRFLIQNYGQGKRVVLIIDEAQNLSPGALESLRMLSNINADKDQLIQIILVGQPQLRALLRLPELHQFSQRVAVDFFVPPLETYEVEVYINHRLKVAGREEPIFTHWACERIAEATKGIPRRINILADMALVYGFASDSEKIDVNLIDEVLKDKAEFGVMGQ